uniref:Phytocyanin domain-containing protein n=1 Tax=Salix viminalis TaxID=40686 RepID=A0A6N2NG56_SALVM
MAGRLSFTVGFLIVASVGLLHGACAATTYTYSTGQPEHTPATEVSTREEYDNCTKMGIILVDAGVTVTFNANGTHYFLCSEGTHCEQGQKMVIKIGDGIAPSFAAPSLAAAAALSALFFSTVAIFFLN